MILLLLWLHFGEPALNVPPWLWALASIEELASLIRWFQPKRSE